MSEFNDEVIFHDGMFGLMGRNGKPHFVREADCLKPVATESGVHFESTVPSTPEGAVIVPDTPEGIESIIPAPSKGSSLVEAAEFMQGLNLLARAFKDQEEAS